MSVGMIPTEPCGFVRSGLPLGMETFAFMGLTGDDHSRNEACGSSFRKSAAYRTHADTRANVDMLIQLLQHSLTAHLASTVRKR